jgi:imidazole glycerol-phosphate synthase subunit HisF
MRIIARLDIKNHNLIKGINLEGLRVIGEPNQYALKYYNEGIDEIIFMDAVASLYGRNNLYEIISKASKNIFIPITVGGGIRSVEDASKAFKSGADKVAVNTAAVENKDLINRLSKKFGSQSIVLSIEAKKIREDYWEVFTNSGRQETGLDVIEWAKNCEKRGAGEILLTSVDKEGTNKGFDCELFSNISKSINIPIIASGGFGKPSDMTNLNDISKVDAIAVAYALHYKKFSIMDIRKEAVKSNIKIRKLV